LSYVLLGWQPKLRNGAALTERYGKAVGYRYSEAEDGGIFWSNNPQQPVMEMIRAVGLELSGDSWIATASFRTVSATDHQQSNNAGAHRISIRNSIPCPISFVFGFKLRGCGG